MPNPASVFALPHNPASVFALLFVIPEGNLLLSLLLLLPLSLAFAFLVVIPEGNLRFRIAAWLSPSVPAPRLGAKRQPRRVPHVSILRHGFPRTYAFFSRFNPRYTALATLLLTVALLGAADPAARTNKLGHEMICTCGCTQILLECNHVGCPVSPVMINELQGQVSQGGPDNLILNWFAAKYGATVLAAPMRGGFDNVAWITPLAVFFFATVGVAFLVTVWKKRNPISAPAPSTMDSTLRARIRQETEY